MNVDPTDSAPPSPFGVVNVKTADVDFDKRIDIIQAVSNGSGADYRVWFNRGVCRCWYFRRARGGLSDNERFTLGALSRRRPNAFLEAPIDVERPVRAAKRAMVLRTTAAQAV